MRHASASLRRRATAAVPIGVVAVAVAAAVPSPAAAAVVPGSSIAGVRVDATAADVRDRLGEPRSVSRPVSEIHGQRITIQRYRGITVTFGPGSSSERRVTAVSTTSRRQRTSKGIRVGSRRSALRRAYRLTCEPVGRRSVCWQGRAEAGRVVTTYFLSSRHRVTRIDVGRIID
ncbi:MAG: hypothetical protein M0P31_14460 [Solirubrobacteraceae bacterium]|nr:hypothetical protein [Solirubrobacteraceae bacterium]